MKKEQLVTSRGCSTDLTEIWQDVRTHLVVTFHQMGDTDFAQFFANQKKTNAPFSSKIS